MKKYFFHECWTRSLIKAVSYRILIIILDFIIVYILSGKIEIAFWFMMISNIYTSAAYFVHERVWNSINWGKTTVNKRTNNLSTNKAGSEG